MVNSSLPDRQTLQGVFVGLVLSVLPGLSLSTAVRLETCDGLR